MLYWLLVPLSDAIQGLNLVRYITFRGAFAAIFSFLVVILCAPGLVAWLRNKKLHGCVDHDSETLAKMRERKQDVPTMGGLLILFSVLFSVLLFGRLDNIYVIVTLGAFLMAFTKLRGKTVVRTFWQVVIVVVLGYLTGDLLSQALLAGWAQNGVTWTQSIGLVLLVTAAFVIPWTTGKQIYCHHLCPHGALQQWIQKLPIKTLRVPARAHRAGCYGASCRWPWDSSSCATATTGHGSRTPTWPSPRRSSSSFDRTPWVEALPDGSIMR